MTVMGAGLYLIYLKTLGRYKLGMSSNVNRRLREYKSYGPFVLVVAYKTKNYLRAKEALLHEVFAEKRRSFPLKWLKHECFDLDTADVQLCRELMERGINLVFGGSSPRIKALRKQQAFSIRAKLLKTQH